MTTIEQRIERLKATVAKWSRSVDRQAEKVARAKARGAAPDRIEKHEHKLTRLSVIRAGAERRLDRARIRQAQQQKVAEITGPLVRHADRVIEKAKAVAPKWKRERKEARTADRRARRLKLDQAKHEGKREIDKRIQFAPDTGSLDALPVNRRHDILEQFFGQRLINEAEKAAGDHFIRLCQMAEMIGSNAGDTDRVSGPGPRTGPGDTALHAKDELERIEGHLGRTGFKLLVASLHLGRTIAQIAAASDLSIMDSKASRRSELYVGRRIRESLEDLSKMRSITGRARHPKEKPLYWRAPDAPKSVRPELWEYAPSPDLRKSA